MKNLIVAPELERPVTSLSGVESSEAFARDLMKSFLKSRRMATAKHSCAGDFCSQCFKPHMKKVVAAIESNLPITFILPAFPGKSPNPAKVIGPLPDMAEEQALRFLNQLCEDVKKRYSPGAKIIICSDGRVFSDVVGISENDISAYQIALDKMIQELNLTNISTFNLDELYGVDDFPKIRKNLMERYGEPLDRLRNRVRSGGKGSADANDQESHRMYCGITRFLFEDSLVPGQTRSRTSLQKQARANAYEVIRRSNAWSNILEEVFPYAVRLSIHPQTCGSKKLGIKLLGNNAWLTPWHGVAVKEGDDFILMKLWELEDSNYRAVKNSAGRITHFDLVHPNNDLREVS